MAQALVNGVVHGLDDGNDLSRLDDLEYIEIPFTYRGKNYVLTEASTDAGVKWRNFVMRCAKMSPEGKPVGMENLADAEPYLVSMCLFEVNGDNRRPLSAVEVRAIPNKVTKKLYNKVMLISDLKDEAEEKLTTEEKIEKAEKELEALRKQAAEEKGENYEALQEAKK